MLSRRTEKRSISTTPVGVTPTSYLRAFVVRRRLPDVHERLKDDWSSSYTVDGAIYYTLVREIIYKRPESPLECSSILAIIATLKIFHIQASTTYLTNMASSTPTIEELLKQQTFKTINDEQVQSFMKHGFLRIPGAIPIENCDRWSKDVWHRLGMDPNDKSTWTNERNHMAKLNVIPAKEIAPKAWAAICELCGGEDRIAKGGEMWTDGFIVNLGSPETEGKKTPPNELGLWHVDGDFFTHFLDSPEQALLVIPCWSDIEENGGATWICDEGPKKIGQFLVSVISLL